jgi:hypothetical protein
MQTPHISLHLHDAPDTGVTLTYRGDNRPPVIESVVSDSAADGCGLTAGLFLYRIQGMDTEVLTEEQIEELIEQRPLNMRFGKNVTLTAAPTSARGGWGRNNNRGRDRGNRNRNDRGGRNRNTNGGRDDRRGRNNYSDEEMEHHEGRKTYGGGAEVDKMLKRYGESDRCAERSARLGGGVAAVNLKPAKLQESRVVETDVPPPSSIPSQKAKRFLNEFDRDDEGNRRQKRFIVGTCQQIEKAYFRLQGDANPAWVRPEEVLSKSLEYVREEWRNGTEWLYCDEQFRSIRQDLFVQGIESDFCVNAYAIGARVALEANDLGQFNQCQTQLKNFFQKGLGKNVSKEFWCYRLLYASHLQQKIEEFDCMADQICRIHRLDPMVQKCCQLREALQLGNFCKYFVLCDELSNASDVRHAQPKVAGEAIAPYYHMAFLLELFLPHVRLRALTLLTKAYGMRLSIEVVASKIHFGRDLDGCREFLTKSKAVLDAGGRLDCRKNNAIFQAAVAEKKVKLMG